MLYESQVAILQLHCERTENLHIALREILDRALNIYPNNFYILSVFADMQVKDHIYKCDYRDELNYFL
jgi:hypothetical protein